MASAPSVTRRSSRVRATARTLIIATTWAGSGVSSATFVTWVSGASQMIRVVFGGRPLIWSLPRTEVLLLTKSKPVSRRVSAVPAAARGSAGSAAVQAGAVRPPGDYGTSGYGSGGYGISGYGV